jgi:hypothetical protein
MGPSYYDVKLHQLQTEMDYKIMTTNINFSISDACWVSGVSNFLQKTFINPSPWERSL